MPKRKVPLWQQKSAAQVVAQWTARREGTQYAEDAEQRDRVVRQLCLELVVAIAERIPDDGIGKELLRIHAAAVCGASIDALRDRLNEELGE